MKSEKLVFRLLAAEEIAPEFLADFRRRQEVMLCYRRGANGWEVHPDPFTDDWTEEERAAVVKALQETAKSGGFVQAAFFEGRPVGFAAVCKQPIGKKREYLDLSELHVSREWRRRGVGRRLFAAAAAWAKEHGWEIAPDNREGIRVSFGEGAGDGWFLLRLSVHDPIMPLNVESDAAGGVRVIVEQLCEYLRTCSGLDISPVTKYLG